MSKLLKHIGCGFAVLLFFFLVLFGIIMVMAYWQARAGRAPATNPSFTAVGTYKQEKGKAASVSAVSDDDPSIGPKDAAVTVVEFSDFECPFCKQAFPILGELRVRYGDRVRFIYRDFPIAEIHKNATKAAEAGECADEQGKFWSMHDKIFQNVLAITVPDLKRYAQESGLDISKFNNCLDSGQFAEEVQDDFRDGILLGVKGTPTWFLNGKRVEGVIPRENFIQILEQLLAVPPQQ